MNIAFIIFLYCIEGGVVSGFWISDVNTKGECLDLDSMIAVVALCVFLWPLVVAIYIGVKANEYIMFINTKPENKKDLEEHLIDKNE